MNHGKDRGQAAGLSVVIPVYNSQDSLPPLVSALAGTLPALSQEFEVILVNDGSKDQSWEAVQALHVCRSLEARMCSGPWHGSGGN